MMCCFTAEIAYILSGRLGQGLLKCAGKGGDGGKSFFCFFCQSAQNNAINIAGQARIQCSWWLWLCTEMLAHQLFQAAPEGELAGEHLVGHDRQGVLIARWHWMSPPLFNRHVGRGAAHVLAHIGCGNIEFSNAEIGQQEIGIIWSLLPGADQEVGRFDILMNNMLLVSMLQRFGSLANKMGDQFRSEWSRLSMQVQPIVQCPFLAKWHHQIGKGSSFNDGLTVIIERQDVGMIKLGDGHCLVLEKTHCPWRGGARGFSAYELDRHFLLNTLIFRQINFSHSAAANFLQQVVAVDLLSFQHHLSPLLYLELPEPGVAVDHLERAGEAGGGGTDLPMTDRVVMDRLKMMMIHIEINSISIGNDPKHVGLIRASMKY